MFISGIRSIGVTWQGWICECVPCKMSKIWTAGCYQNGEYSVDFTINSGIDSARKYYRLIGIR